MIEEVQELLQRQVEAMTVLEGRLRAVELLAAAGQHRFLARAMDELDIASERLAALELGRSMTLTSLGLSPELSPAELAVAVDDHDGQLAPVIAAMARAAQRLADAQHRAAVAVGAGREEITRRLELSAELQPA